MNKKIAEAYKRSQIGRTALNKINARCMEVTEDKCGIVWERYIIQVSPNSSKNLILFATPSWWDVFVPLETSGSNDSLVAAIKALVDEVA
jgi:hypothetical protein